MYSDTRNEEFDAIYRRTYKALYRFCRKLCRSREDAEDVAMETYTRAFAAFDRYQAASSIENWLMRIAKNVFLDTMRMSHRRPSTVSESSLFDGHGLELVVDQRPNPEDALFDQNNWEELVDSLQLLDGGTRELVIQAHVKQIPHEEIASANGIRCATLRTKLYRARQTLRRDRIARRRRESEGAYAA
jgi:RNA polymerase sigma-70 factor (ECF subfamily)